VRVGGSGGRKQVEESRDGIRERQRRRRGQVEYGKGGGYRNEGRRARGGGGGGRILNTGRKVRGKE